MRKLYEEIKNVYPKRVIELVKQQLNRGMSIFKLELYFSNISEKGNQN